jgi:hypothetical protein
MPTITALPTAQDIQLYIGDDFYCDVTVTNPDGSAADLSSVTAAAQVRASASDTNTLAVFTCTIAGNIIHLKLPHTETVKLTAGSAAVWDCQITASGSGDITTLVAGKITGTAEVTRP